MLLDLLRRCFCRYTVWQTQMRFPVKWISLYRRNIKENTRGQNTKYCCDNNLKGLILTVALMCVFLSLPWWAEKTRFFHMFLRGTKCLPPLFHLSFAILGATGKQRIWISCLPNDIFPFNVKQVDLKLRSIPKCQTQNVCYKCRISIPISFCSLRGTFILAFSTWLHLYRPTFGWNSHIEWNWTDYNIAISSIFLWT